jgi:hypothetical protein
MKTDRLIETLTQDVMPLEPLSTPWLRAAWWLLGTVVYWCLVVWLMVSPADFGSSGWGLRFGFNQLSATLGAAIAACAALASTVPGFSRQIFSLSAAAALVWVGSLSIGAVQDWTLDGISVAASGELACVAMIVFGSVAPGSVLAIMLRRGAPLTPGLTAAMGMFATSSLASVSACVSHPHPNDAVTLVWHGATILLLVTAALRVGPRVLTWRTGPLVRERTGN